jgi:hypothetical protein
VLSEFIAHNYDQIIRRCRQTGAPPSVIGEVDHRMILDQLVDALRSGLSAAHPQRLATARFQYRVPAGLTVLQVLREHCDVRNAITTLAFDMNDAVSVDECLTLDRCIDDAVVNAITEFSQKCRVLPVV